MAIDQGETHSMQSVRPGPRGFPATAVYRDLKFVLLDVDGVLTDGRIIYDANGVESKFFHVHDGPGLMLLGLAGIRVGLLSGRQSEVTARRALDLKIPMERVYQGITHKGPILKEIAVAEKIDLNQIAYVGDDLIDLPVLEQVGLACCPSNARSEVLNAVHAVSMAVGGFGSVRQISEHILMQRKDGTWERVLEEYLGRA